MPATITLSDLSWATPDGRPLFSHLDLSFGAERTGLVGRNGTGKSTLLALMAGTLAPQAGQVAVSGTLAVLRQDVQQRPGGTIATLFGVEAGLKLLARAERGEATADELAEADWTLESRISTVLAEVGLDVTPNTPLATLSGGQGTRAALAALLFAAPDFILLDEPTNNLDRDGRAAVAEILQGWRGGALVVSHDRELLERMDAIVELTSMGATRYGGNWTQYRAQKALELAAAQHDLSGAERELAQTQRSAQLRAERQARRNSVGRKDAAKGGTPRIMLGMMKNRAESTGGGQARLADKREQSAADVLASARGRIEVLQPLTVTLPPTGLAAGKTVLRLDAVTAGYMPGQPVIDGFGLTITGPERVAVTGPNGVGKSTLLALVCGALAPWRGSVRALVPWAMLDQRVSLLDPAATIADNFRRLNPASDDNACRAALARFMFRADAALQVVGTLSGGQLLRAGLACTLGGLNPPQLLLLDEPTNHLDIDSIAEVEAGLRAYDGALLVVSHDQAFLAAIGITRTLALGET